MGAFGGLGEEANSTVIKGPLNRVIATRVVKLVDAMHKLGKDLFFNRDAAMKTLHRLGMVTGVNALIIKPVQKYGKEPKPALKFKMNMLIANAKRVMSLEQQNLAQMYAASGHDNRKVFTMDTRVSGPAISGTYDVLRKRIEYEFEWKRRLASEAHDIIRSMGSGRGHKGMIDLNGQLDPATGKRSGGLMDQWALKYAAELGLDVSTADTRKAALKNSKVEAYKTALKKVVVKYDQTRIIQEQRYMKDLEIGEKYEAAIRAAGGDLDKIRIAEDERSGAIRYAYELTRNTDYGGNMGNNATKYLDMVHKDTMADVSDPVSRRLNILTNGGDMDFHMVEGSDGTYHPEYYPAAGSSMTPGYAELSGGASDIISASGESRSPGRSETSRPTASVPDRDGFLDLNTKTRLEAKGIVQRDIQRMLNEVQNAQNMLNEPIYIAPKDISRAGEINNLVKDTRVRLQGIMDGTNIRMEFGGSRMDLEGLNQIRGDLLKSIVDLGGSGGFGGFGESIVGKIVSALIKKVAGRGGPDGHDRGPD